MGRITIRARFPGAAGALRVRLTLRLGEEARAAEFLRLDSAPPLTAVNDPAEGDVVWVNKGLSSNPPARDGGGFYRLERAKSLTGEVRWRLHGPLQTAGQPGTRLAERPKGAADLCPTDTIRVLTASLTVATAVEDRYEQSWDGLSLDPVSHPAADGRDSLFARFREHPQRRRDALSVPLVIEYENHLSGNADALDVLTLLFADEPTLEQGVVNDPGDDDHLFSLSLEGGNDGRRPTADEYFDEAERDSPIEGGLLLPGHVDEMSIVAAPQSIGPCDEDWKYVKTRRYLVHLERSLDSATQWVVFEPNDETLWPKVRREVAEILDREFKAGALAGERPESAYFAKCDRSTMTQADFDEGRLVCLVGVAVLRPAEFVILRIRRWAADAKRNRDDPLRE